MKTPEEILRDNGVRIEGSMMVRIIAAMEEYKNQFIDAKLEEKLRIQYDAELEAFKNNLAFDLGNANEIINLREKELQAAKDEIFRLQELIHNTTRL